MTDHESVKDLAAALHVSEPTIWRWIRLGMPRGMRGLHYVYRLEDVLNWLDARSLERQKRFVRVFRAKKKPPAETGGPSAKCFSKDTPKSGGAR